MPAVTKKNGAAKTPPVIETIPYDDGVAECKEIVLKIEDAERGQLRIGEVADNLELEYGDRTIAKFAAAIGIAKCTVDRYRTVYRAWKGKLAPGPNLVPSYAVLRELAKHPEREQIIAKYPDTTKREAHDLMRKHNGTAKEAKEAAQESQWLKHYRKWFKDLVALTNDVSSAAAVPDQCTAEQLENLLKAVDPKALMHIRAAGRRLFNVANQLAELLNEEVQPFGREPITHARRAEAEEATAQAAIN
jgi:hypothetical protein